MGRFAAPILALAIKDLRHLYRDRGAAFFTLLFPLLVALFFGFIFGGAGGEHGKMKIAVVNEDGRELSAGFVRDMATDTALEIKMAATREEGMMLVRKNKTMACIIVPKDFGDAGQNMFSGGGLSVEAIYDPSKTSEVGLLTGKLNELSFQQLSKVFADTSRMTDALDKAKAQLTSSKDVSLADKALFSLMFESIKRAAGTSAWKGTPAEPATNEAGGVKREEKESPNAAADEGEASKVAGGAGGVGGMGGWRPITVTMTELPNDRAEPRTGYEVSFIQGIVWGLMGCVTAFGASMAAERSKGTLLRLTIAPITRHQILAGKALSTFLACMVVQAMLVVFGVVVFGIRIPSVGLLALVATAAAIGFTGVMMLMAGFSRTEGGGAGMGRGLILVLAMIGGGTVPVFILPAWMQTVSKVSPFTWATIAFEGVTWRGLGIADLLMPMGVLLLFGVVGFIIGVTALKWGD